MSNLGKVLIHLIGKQRRYPMPVKNLSDYLSCVGYERGRNHLKIQEGLEKSEIVLQRAKDTCYVFPVQNISEVMTAKAQAKWYLSWLENPKQF